MIELLENYEIFTFLREKKIRREKKSQRELRTRTSLIRNTANVRKLNVMRAVSADGKSISWLGGDRLIRISFCRKAPDDNNNLRRLPARKIAFIIRKKRTQ